MRAAICILHWISAVCTGSAVLMLFLLARTPELRTVVEYLHVLVVVGVGILASLAAISIYLAGRSE